MCAFGLQSACPLSCPTGGRGAPAEDGQAPNLTHGSRPARGSTNLVQQRVAQARATAPRSPVTQPRNCQPLAEPPAQDVAAGHGHAFDL